MATLATRDFLGIMDHHYLHSSSSSSSSSSSASIPIHCTNSLQMDCEEVAGDGAMNDPSVKRKRSADLTFFYGGTVYACHSISPLQAHAIIREAHRILVNNNNNSAKRFKSTASSLKCEGLMHHPLSRNSMIPPKIPLTREVSLARFFQKRKERIETMRQNSSDRFLQLKSKCDREAIDELNNPSTKRNCVLS